MIGSCVSRCTNHLCGTGIRDLNCGGSVLCSNTSFTHCTTTTTEYSNQHLTFQTNITTTNTLHLFSLCTFKECSVTSGGGGAIIMSIIAADLEIASCSFDSCSAPSSAGGALMYYQSATPSSIVISSSSFVNCSSRASSGGSLYLIDLASITISESVFLDSQTTSLGGAVYIRTWNAELSNTGLSNCLFRNCTTSVLSPSSGGGALYFAGCSSIRLDFLQFGECVSATGNGQDLYFRSPLPSVSLTTVSNCDSTSTPQASRIYPTTIAVDDVLPDPTDTTTIHSLVAQSTTSTTAEIVVTLDKTLTGSLLVLVSNSEGTPRTDTTKAPNIGRVLVFSIESSNIGRCTASTGETGLLQVPLEDYKIVTASLSKHIVSFSDVSLETIVLHPTVTSAECVLDETNTHALLDVEGSDLEDATFTLTLQNESPLNAAFTKNKATVDLGMIGESSGWMESEMFVVMKGMNEDDNSIVVSIPSPLYFTIPLAACLSNIEVSDLNDAQTGVTLSFSSRLLKGNQKYEITMARKGGSGRVVMDLKTDNSGLLASQTVILYPSNENEVGWKNSLGFGEEYEVLGVSAKTGEDVYPILFSPILLTMPMEPVLVKNAGCSTDQAATTIVWISGSGLIENETYTLTVSGTPTSDPLSLDHHNTSISVVASSSTDAQSLTLPLSSTSGSSLLFGRAYTISAITNGSVIGIVEGTPSFTTRPTPTLTSLSCKLKEGDPKTVEISLSGSDIPNGHYYLVLKNTVNSKEIELKMNLVNSEGQVEIDIFSSSEVEYGGKYEVVSLWSSSLTVALPTSATYRSLKVPDAPARVTSASCVLSGEKKTHVKIVIFGKNLPVKGTLSVKVKEVYSTGSTIGSENELPEASITSTTSTGPVEIEIFGVMNPCLEYGKTYELSSLTISGTSSWILDESVRFSVPCEPVRITSAWCTTNETDWTVVTVEGSGFVLEEFYTVSVSGLPSDTPSPPSSSPHNTSFGMIASHPTEATSSPIQLYPSEGSQLKFSYSYTIVGISNGSVDGVVHSVVFETQDDVKRDEALITKIEIVPTTSLNTSIVIDLAGTNLPSGTVGLMTLNDSFSLAISFSSSSFGRSEVIELGVSGSLAFGSEYKITTFEDSNQQSIQIPETTIVSTPPKPSKLSLCVCGNEERGGMDLSGADPETCNSIQSAWKTATSLGILDTTMRIVDSADLSSPLIVTTRVPFNLISFQMEPATLRANQLASQPASALVSVEEGGLCRLTLLTITADLSVSTFKLVSASKGTVVLRSCSIEGTRQRESNSEDESICGWSRGLIELFETDTELNGVTMKEIVVGGIWMRGGKLKVTAGVFSQNGPSIADFPSARQNIHCEGEGAITIQSLSEGDGTEEQSSAWLDVSECRIEAKQSIVSSPLFVPTLNSTESKVETDKNGKQTLKVVGKTLMPCGLSLEVFEWDSSKSVEGKSELVDLSTSTATHWNESEISIPFSMADVPKLNKKMEWRGRLVFGNGERTSNWMTVLEVGSGNKSLGGVGSKWWIPAIICLSCALLVALVIVVCVCFHRKRHPNQKELLKNEEMSAAQVEEEEKMEENDVITNPPNSALSSLQSAQGKQGTVFVEARFSNEDVIAPGQSCVEVIVCNEKMESSVAVETDTLFNALHNARSTRFVEKRQVGQAIARGLAGLVEMGVIVPVVTRLSPHWVLFDKNDRVCLKTRETPSVLGESGVVGGVKKTSEDGQRWMAPEVGLGNWELTKENADHGAVFSLGLVLWEIETGCVPFGEVDGATAQRRLASSEKPVMEKVSSSMEAIIVPCLSLDPSQRPTLKTVLSQLLELDSVPHGSNEKEGNAMSKIG
ncbi:hypothetical protein BLNAU_18873 [Blattamonas nauphoetae]|uniref:Protein kinase domain-containing protein n=1 Tax=Blattamonas nauphoetae TaxID=2049346 RepID=A0ABQ9X5L7_9EUKA|nr:hypothetical protein BLNAU_18873 [Blattamonas nauphoetae]